MKSVLKNVIRPVIGKSSGQSWSPQTLVVEDATPTHVDITFPSAKTVSASDFTITGFTVLSGSWTGSIYTLILTIDVIATDILVVIYNGKSYNVTNNVNPFCSEYITALAAMVVKPSTPIQKAQNTLIEAWVNCGAWATRDIYYLFTTNTVANSLINLKTPGTFNGTLVSNNGFISNYGYLGDGTSAYIRTNYIPSSNKINLSLNSASMGIGSIKPVAALNGNICSAFDGTNFSQIGTFWGDSNTYFVLNSSNYESVASTSSNANWTINRTANNVCNLHKNKVKTAGTALSTGITAKEIFIGARNNNGVSSQWSTESYGYFHTGGSMTDGQINTVSDAQDVYKAFMIKQPTDTIVRQLIHIDYINGNYQFGWDAANIFYSSNAGVSWTTVAFANADKIESSVIFSNGNVWFCYLNHCYMSTDGLTNVSEVTALDILGNPYATPIAGSYYKKTSYLDIDVVGGLEMVVWANYANAAPPSMPINIYRMFNDCIPKITYTFGVNPAYPGVGDVGNPVICRHGHGTAYDTINQVWYLTTGDFVPACPMMRGTYNSGTDVFTWAVVPTSPSDVVNIAGIWYLDGYLYYVTDMNGDSLWRCIVGDISTVSKHIKIFTVVGYLYYFKIESNGVGIGVGDGGRVYLTQNFFATQTMETLAGYTDFTKISKMANNFYKIEEYIPPTYYTRSFYVTIIP